MNIRPYILLASLAGATLLSACDVDHNALGTPPPTTAYIPAPTTTTTPTPDLNGQYCWTERNTYLPEGVEGLCSPDFDKPNPSFFLHWGMPKVADYQNRICKGDGREECPLAPTPTTSAPTTTTTPIMEDDPRWDCHTMGNRICGPGKG